MIKSEEVKKKYLEFFEKKGHKIIQPSPLVLEGDPTTLFNSAGMQQLVPNLKGEPFFEDGKEYKRLVDSQPSLRLQDIEEVGDGRHTTYFEMLGNWSLGDYFKKEQLTWVWEFMTKEMNLAPEKLYVSVFEGTKEVPKDDESIAIWRSLGVSENHIFAYPATKNWWSLSGVPEKMPVGEIGGPDSEIFYEFTDVLHDSQFGEKCHPNCDCGRFLEIGNSVFIQYEKQKDGSLKELPQKNVDFGGGWERITAAVNGTPDVFEGDIYKGNIERLVTITGKKYEENKKAMQVIADHMRAAGAIVAEGIVPSNKLQGYVLRRLIRRAALKMRNLKSDFTVSDFSQLTNKQEIIDEVAKFLVSLEKGLREIGKIKEIDGKIAFDLYQSYGFPLELTEEIARDRGQDVDKEMFEKEFKKHKELSRTASAGMFKGGMIERSEDVVKLHTTTHLLHAALRKVLGEHVSQKGSNITAERLRFDFSHPQKLTEEELKKVEDLVNEQISKDIPVSLETKNLDVAIKSGALHFFAEKYGEKVKVYQIGDFSHEICGGPHVASTGMIGHVRIIKQEKVGSGTVRIYATNKN
jgi:alanyl-tRNA synthetase